jgi:hypothetical protein
LKTQGQAVIFFGAGQHSFYDSSLRRTLVRWFVNAAIQNLSGNIQPFCIRRNAWLFLKILYFKD